MPLAQNYKDDVSLLESEAALVNTTVTQSSAEPGPYQGAHTKIHVSTRFSPLRKHWFRISIRVRRRSFLSERKKSGSFNNNFTWSPRIDSSRNMRRFFPSPVQSRLFFKDSFFRRVGFRLLCITKEPSTHFVSASLEKTLISIILCFYHCRQRRGAVSLISFPLIEID